MAPCDEVFHIRRARPADARAIAEIHVATWRQAYRDQLPASFLSGLSVEQREQHWSRELGVLPAGRRPWVAETRDGLVGFVIGGGARDEALDPSVGEVYALYVLPDCWDRGVGRSLLVHAERDLHDHGYTHAVLWCLADNARARYFYESLGWQSDGATKIDSFGGLQMQEVRYRIALDKSRIAEGA